MTIKVTDLSSGNVSFFAYSSNNWARRPACMINDLVVMWVPSKVARGVTVVTSGHRWEIV